MAPQVVALKQRGKKEVGRVPAEVYAYSLEEERWGRKEADGAQQPQEQPQLPEWGTEPIAAMVGEAGVKEGPSEME